MHSGQIAGLVLAGGLGSRMKSTLPKVLHQILGKPMLAWVLDALQDAGVEKSCVVTGHGASATTELLSKRGCSICRQKNLRGTADAVAASYAAWEFEGIAAPPFADGEWVSGKKITAPYVLIAYGDTPALSADTLKQFIRFFEERKARYAVVGIELSDPQGYGRITLDKNGKALRIIEEKDANAEQKKIRLVNAGLILIDVKILFSLLREVTNHNSQNEYYLTDVVELAAQQGMPAEVFVAPSAEDFLGVNDRKQLADLERIISKRVMRGHQLRGVSLRLPESIYIDAAVAIGEDSEVASGVVLKGSTRVGKNCVIGSNAFLHDTVLADGAQIGSGSVLIGQNVSAGTVIPPLSLLEEP